MRNINRSGAAASPAQEGGEGHHVAHEQALQLGIHVQECRTAPRSVKMVRTLLQAAVRLTDRARTKDTPKGEERS